MKAAKLLILFLSIHLLVLSSCSGGKSTKNEIDEKPIEIEKTFVEQHGKLSVNGLHLVNQQGEKLQLRGVSLGWHCFQPRFYDQSVVEWVHQDWNCNFIRAAIGVDPKKAFIEDPNFAYQCLFNVVDAAIAKGMYIIVDWHSHTIKTEEAKGFFTIVATKYKDYPNIIYEIFNEPVHDSWELVKEYSEEIIQTIRAIDPDNLILVGSPHWDQDIHIAADNPIEGYENLMYTLHFYAGTHKQELRDRGSYALEKGLPLFISECAAMEASGDGPLDHEEWQRWLDWMNQHNLSWATWSLSDKNETCSMIKDYDSPLTKWSEDDLKEWGQVVRKTLKAN